MKRLLRVLCLVAALSIVSYGPVLAEVPVVVDVQIPIDVEIPVVEALEATVEGTISFDTTGVTTSAPWRVSSGYINVEYNCNTAL